MPKLVQNYRVVIGPVVMLQILRPARLQLLYQKPVKDWALTNTVASPSRMDTANGLKKIINASTWNHLMESSVRIK